MATITKRRAPQEPMHKRATPTNGDAAKAFVDRLAKGDVSGALGLKPMITPQEEQPLPKPTSDQDEVVLILVSNLEPHPQNQRPTPDEVAMIADSFSQEERQLEPIDVRPLSNGKYQIISGETRWLGAKERGWRHLKARVHAWDDKKALRMLAIFNSKRKVLDPIRKARVIANLVESGMTLEEAGQTAGINIKTAGGASNLKRLLDLPDVWQQRVISGEFAESFARLLLPYCHAPRLMAALNADYLNDQKRGDDQFDEGWGSRLNVERSIEHVVSDNIRPVDEKQQFNYYSSDFRKALEKLKVKDHWHYRGDYPILFELTPELEAKLDIVELTFEKKSHRYATNVALYDKHQLPAIVAHVDAKAKKAFSRAGVKADAKPPKKLTAAQEKARKADQQRQLDARIKAWRHKLLRSALIKCIEHDGDNGVRLVLAVIANRPSAVDFWDLVSEATKIQAMRHKQKDWQLIGSLEQTTDQLEVLSQIAVQLLAMESRDKKYPVLAHELIEDYATALNLDVGNEWRDIQPRAGGPTESLLEEFYLLHGKDQLIALGEELGVYCGGDKSKDVMVKRLCGKIVKLPKSIAPLAKARAKKGGGK